MKELVQRGSKRLFYLTFGIIFSILILCLLIHNTAFYYSKGALILLTALALLFFWIVSIVLKKYEAWLERHYSILLALFLGWFAVLQFICATRLRFEPVFDLGAIYYGAIEWVETGTFSSYYEYYHFFPNNLGGMFFLSIFFFLAHKLGITDYFMVAAVVNGLCVLAAMAVTAEICRKILGIRHAIFAMVLFVVCLPFYFMAAVFYTDSLSMLFPVLMYYLYLKIKESEKRKLILLFAALMGLAAAIGMLIKFTVAIMLIAIALDSLLHLSWKRTGVIVGMALAVVLLIFTAFQGMIYSHHLDRETARQNNTPYLHWVMMGLQGDGGYNSEDYAFTRSFTDIEERDAAIRQEITARLKRLGPVGTIDLTLRKAVKTFGNGTFCQSDFLDDTPLEDTWLHPFVLYNGRQYEVYKHLCQGVFTAVLTLMTLAAFRDFGLGRRSTAEYLAPRAAVFGVMLFFCAWETSGRYLTNYVPVIFTAAVMGVDLLGGLSLSSVTSMLRYRAKSRML